MDKFLKITPLDPLFFRSPIPFTAGEQDWAESSPLPLPGTLYGAIRSLILSRRDFERFLNGGGYNDIGAPEKKGSLKFKVFTLFKDKQRGLEPYFPVPANLLGKYEENKKEGKKLIAVKKPFPMGLERVLVSNSGEVSEFFYLNEDGFEQIGDYFLSVDGLKKYLKGNDLFPSDFVKKSEFFVEEPKVGIARERDTKATQEGKLYRVNHHRYMDGTGFVAWIEGTDENLKGIFTLGGERRTAEIKEIENPFGELEAQYDGKRFLVYLATPAIFNEDWKPSAVVRELEENGVKLKLITAAIPGYRIISGWDIQKKAPKTLYKAAPEGSVYVFEVINGSIDTAVEAFHFKNISDVNPEEGYGFALVGKLRKTGGYSTVRKGTLLFVTVETPLHAGTGSELGIVDLPIQRERHTGWPKVEASGLKGALREAVNLSDNLKKAIFGPEEDDLHSGSLVLTDLRILLFPVKSAKGTFAWVISSEVYKRFKKDLKALAGIDESIKGLLKDLPNKLEANAVHSESGLTVEVEGKDMVLLEEFSFEVKKKSGETLGKFVQWLMQNVFKDGDPRHDDLPKKICVVEDDMFNDFVKMFTEVITRTKIDNATGTVDKTTGGLWNEEYLPSDTIMYSLIMTTPLMMKNSDKPAELKDSSPASEAQKVLSKTIEALPDYLFLGGNETVGKGFVSLKVVGGKS